MKRLFALIALTAIILPGCLTIDDEPIVNLDPIIDFQSHIRNTKVYVTATVIANPNYVNPGNMPAVFEYNGELQLINDMTGTIVSLNAITGTEYIKVTTVSADTLGVDGFIAIADGTITVYADKEADGNRSNDILLSTSEFHGEVLIDFRPPPEE